MIGNGRPGWCLKRPRSGLASFVNRMAEKTGEDEIISKRRQSFDERFLPWIEGFVLFVARHWLGLLNTALGIFAGLPVLSPLLEASDNRTLNFAGDLIFLAYHATCHQMPQRSFFIFQHQMAWCERDTAIWGTLFLAGLLFSLIRRHVDPLPIRWYILFCVPMAIDGTTQLFGWRESTWELRLITGFLFGLASAWLVFPILERGMREVRDSLDRPAVPMALGAPVAIEQGGEGLPLKDDGAIDGLEG
jgi:uncharacterized membrane protein